MSETKMIEARRQWVCGVGASGYHNGCNCRPDEPHGGWGCGWYYVGREPAPEPVPATI